MAFPGDNYAPPGPYTRTLFENPLSGAVDTLKIPVFIGEGNEFLGQSDLELVRGSSATIDQKITDEDMTGRAVVAVSATNVITRGAFDGTLSKISVRNFPIVSGDGTGTTTTNRADVSVKINGLPIVIVSVDGVNGIIELATTPKAGDNVQATYFFNRTDTLQTDDVSAQVSADAAIVRAGSGIADANSQTPSVPAATLNLHADILNAQGAVVVAANNVLKLTVDGAEQTITIPPRTDYTMAQIAASITAANVGTLTGSTFINQFGESALQLNGTNDIAVLDGSSNADLGLATGQASIRTKVFYVFNGPMVDGTNAGVTTTDTTKVTVTVDNVAVVPTKVDGTTRAVTLAQAPAPGASVKITYWHNTYQDTFDYLAHVGVTAITRAGDVPGSSSFTQEADYVLQDDKIIWGTAVTVKAGVNTTGAEFFDDTQITPTLIDNRSYMEPCVAVSEVSGGLNVASQTKFTLPRQPTLGNGRDTKLGASLFQTLSNTRIDLPVNRPDVVDVYWGFSVQDALDRGKVTVISVEGIVVTLLESVPPGATVFASMYHNMLTDETYTLTAVIAGASGTGTYTVQDKASNDVFGATYDTGTKGAGLTGITVEFPSGSELTPDLHFEAVSGDDFTGPVEEIVTVEFAARAATPAKYSVPGSGDYEIIRNESDHLRLSVDSVALTSGATGVDLSSPTVGHAGGFGACLLGDEIVYDGGASSVSGVAYDLTASEQGTITVDGADVAFTSDIVNTVNGSELQGAINEAANGHQAAAVGGGVNTITLAAASRSNVDDYYNGWLVVVGNGAAVATAGQAIAVTDYDGTTGIATVASNWAGGAVGAADEYYIYDAAARSPLKGATRFNGAVTLGANLFDKLQVSFTGDTSGVLAVEADLGDGPFATPTALATEVQAQITAAITAAASAPHAGLIVECAADADGRLELRLQLPGVDGAGVLQVLTAAGGAATDFAVLAGFDTAAAAAGGQAALIQAPIADFYGLLTSGRRPFDRMILRNRVVPGGGAASTMTHHDVASQIELKVKIGNTRAGLATGEEAFGGGRASVNQASLVGRVGFAGGQVAVTAQPQVTFFDGTGATAVNNVMQVTIDGTPVTVTFTATATGTATPLGPATGTSNGSVMDQIIDALAAVPGTPFGATAAAVFATGMVLQEGAGIRLTSLLSSVNSVIVLGNGTANAVLGFNSGDTAQRVLVKAKQVASALMANRNTTFATQMLGFASTNALFYDEAMAGVQQDAAGKDYLYLQSRTVGGASAITMLTTSVGGIQTDDALFIGTGILAANNDGAVGEAALDGYFVQSNILNGSGSVNDSLLNDDAGQDGIVGQTYRDKVTGLTFTILPRGWSTNETGPWVAYPTGATASFRIAVSKTFTTDANLPHNAINGVDLTVANTTLVGVGDTATVQTFERGGEEPTVGDVYYASYIYTKQDFTTSFFTKQRAVEAAFGTTHPDNPVSLASFLAILNGAVLVGIKQVPRATGANQASVTTYRDAVDELEGVLPGQALPDIITPLRVDSSLYLYLKRSNNIQSSIRYKAERTSIVGAQAGTLPEDAQLLGKSLKDQRMRMVYPDMATLTLTDSLNVTSEFLVDGPMMAAALAGSVVSPNLDVATPWTGRLLVGFTQVARSLDAVEMNQAAKAGLTVLENKAPFLRVRHGLTTDMSNIITKTPTIVMIADEVQRQSRATLEVFIGIKFLPGILSQVEGRLAMLLKGLVKGQIITAYTGIQAITAPDDPTVAEVEAFYSPVFPLLYLVLTFHLRSTLGST